MRKWRSNIAVIACSGKYTKTEHLIKASSLKNSDNKKALALYYAKL